MYRRTRCVLELNVMFKSNRFDGTFRYNLHLLDKLVAILHYRLIGYGPCSPWYPDVHLDILRYCYK